ncbi:MAG: hypothetical protein ACRELB_07550 [Polyangiaceae bacterium]
MGEGARLDAFTSSGKYLGTDALGRRLTDAESKRLGLLLREHEFTDASMVALRFAFKLTRRTHASHDLMGRANLRLVCTGWDPNEVTLVKRLCRVVWSEWTHQLREDEQARAAVEVFIGEQKQEGYALPAAPAKGDPLRAKKQAQVAPSYEQLAGRLDEERADEERHKKQRAEMRKDLREVRAKLEKDGDEENRIYFDRKMAPATADETPEDMAKATTRPVSDFYAAQKRRVRAVQKHLEKKHGAPGSDEDNE